MKVITRKINKLGRIVLPMDFRKLLRLEIDSEICMEIDGVGIKIKCAKDSCKICGIILERKSTLQICAECIRKIKNI